MTVHVSGSVKNSVFAASYQPFGGVYGDPNSLALTGGDIKGKIEGKVDNGTETPSTPLVAFFAKKVTAFSGPVVPPNVPQAPYTGPQSPSHFPGIHKLGTAKGHPVSTPKKA